jgi:hypothetical protein
LKQRHFNAVLRLGNKIKSTGAKTGV